MMDDEHSKKKVNLELIDYKITALQSQMTHMESTINKQMVSRSEFDLRVGRLEKIVYGMVTLVLVAVVGALLTLVISQ